MADLLHHILRYVHIVVGSIGLILFWIPIFARKGGVWHRRAGRGYVYSVYVVTITALTSCLWGWIHPVSFMSYVGREPTAQDVAQIRFFYAILGVLAAMALTGAVFGMQILKVKDSGTPMGSPALRVVLSVEFLASIGALTYCASLVISGSFVGLHSILVVLAGFTLLDSINVLRSMRNPRRIPWLIQHFEALLACGIAFHTAALVTISNVALKLPLPGPLQFLPWVLPTLIGVPAIELMKRRYKRKLKPG